MTPSAIAQLVAAMVLPELAKYGAAVPWRQVKSQFDVQLQKAIPLHWVEGPIQKAGDLVLDACAAMMSQTAKVAAICQLLAAGRVPEAEAKFLALIVEVQPGLAGLVTA